MRKGTKQTGKFQIQEGMAFTMPDSDLVIRNISNVTPLKIPLHKTF